MKPHLLLVITFVLLTPAAAQEETSLKDVLTALDELGQQVTVLSQAVNDLRRGASEEGSPNALRLALEPAAGAVRDERAETLDDVVFELAEIRKLASDLADAFPDDQNTLKETSQAIKAAIAQLKSPDSDVSQVRSSLKLAIARVLLSHEDALVWTKRLDPIFQDIQSKIDDLGTTPEDFVRERLAEFYGQVAEVLDHASARTAGDAPVFSTANKEALDSWERLWQQFEKKVREESPSVPATFTSNVREYVGVLRSILETRYGVPELARIKRDTFDATEQFIKMHVVGTKPKRNMIELYNTFVLWVENESGDGDTVEGWKRNLLQLAGRLNQFAVNEYPAWFREAQQRFGDTQGPVSSRIERSGRGPSSGSYGGRWPGYDAPDAHWIYPHHRRFGRHRLAHHHH